jgi:hypothetical protein
LTESEPLKRCREVATSSQKLQGGALRKCLEDIFNERASWRGGNMEEKVIVAILLITEITYLYSVRLASFRGQELFLVLVTELGKLHTNDKGNVQ